MWCWEVRSGWQCGDGRASEEADPCPHSRGPGAWQLAAEWAWPCGCHATCHMSPHLSSRGCWLLPRRRPPATTTPPRASSRAARASPSSTWIFGGWAGPGAQTRMLGEVQTFLWDIKWKTEFRKRFCPFSKLWFFFRIQALREELLRGSYDIVLLQVLSVHCFIFYYDFEYEECVRKGLSAVWKNSYIYT